MDFGSTICAVSCDWPYEKKYSLQDVAEVCQLYCGVGKENIDGNCVLKAGSVAAAVIIPILVIGGVIAAIIIIIMKSTGKKGPAVQLEKKGEKNQPE